jgi:hypothetical protein
VSGGFATTVQATVNVAVAEAQACSALSEWEDAVSVVFLRAYIEMAAMELDQPLSADQREALDYFEAVAHRPDVKLFRGRGRGGMERGDGFR